MGDIGGTIGLWLGAVRTENIPLSAVMRSRRFQSFLSLLHLIVLFVKTLGAGWQERRPKLTRPTILRVATVTELT